MIAQLKTWVRRGVEPAARVIASSGITPNTLTLVALILNAGVGLVLAQGYTQIGGLLVLLVGAFDIFDGAVARVSGRVTTFGAFLDSVVDRYSEALIFLGILIHASNIGDSTAAILTYVTIIGSVMVSYARARAEGLGLQGEVGLLQRPERVLILGIGLLMGQITPTLWVLAILTNFTALQRVWHVRRLTKSLR